MTLTALSKQSIINQLGHIFNTFHLHSAHYVRCHVKGKQVSYFKT